MKADIGKAFSKLKESMYEKWRGCLIEKKNGEFIWGHKIHNTLEEAKKSIDKAIEEWDKINNLK